MYKENQTLAESYSYQQGLASSKSSLIELIAIEKNEKLGKLMNDLIEMNIKIAENNKYIKMLEANPELANELQERSDQDMADTYYN